MPKCQIKRGFLMLSECGAATTRICPECGRAACDEHLVKEQGGKKWVCVECYAKLDKSEPPAELEGETTTAAWRHRYRERYYHDNNYTPYVAGAYLYSEFNDEDVRSFDAAAAESGDMLETEDGVDFMDS